MRFVTVDPSLHTRDPETIEAVYFSGRIASKESKDRSIDRKSHGNHFFGFLRCDPCQLFAEGKDNHGQYNSNLLTQFDAVLKEKQSRLQLKKVLFYHDNKPALLSCIVVSKLNEIRISLLPTIFTEARPQRHFSILKPTKMAIPRFFCRFRKHFRLASYYAESMI